MKRFRVIEVRKTAKGELFAVEHIRVAESEHKLRKFIDESNPCLVVDKNYRIKEIEDKCRL